MAEVHQDVSALVLWVLIFHYARVHAGAHLGSHTVLEMRLVVAYTGHIIAGTGLHICKVVQEVNTLNGGEWHLRYQTVGWSTACAAFVEHGDGRHVTVRGISSIRGKRYVPSLWQ